MSALGGKQTLAAVGNERKATRRSPTKNKKGSEAATRLQALIYGVVMRRWKVHMEPAAQSRSTGTSASNASPILSGSQSSDGLMMSRPRLLKDTAMKHFGTVQSFKETTGHGFIRPEDGGNDLSFDRSEMLWDQMVSPRPGVRLSYHLSGREGHATAINLQLAPLRTFFTV